MLTEEDNLELLNKRISTLKIKGNIVIAFDFDELVVPIHLARTITKKVARPIDMDKLNFLGGSSFEGINYIRESHNGILYVNYSKIRDRIARETEWREGFKPLLQKLMEKFTLIFISSGVKDMCYAKLKEIKFNQDNILAGEFRIENGKLNGSNLIVTDKDKGYIVKRLKEKFKVIAIGHSLGDKFMLENADVSISFNSDAKDLAQFNVKTAEELFEVIEREAKKLGAK